MVKSQHGFKRKKITLILNMIVKYDSLSPDWKRRAEFHVMGSLEFAKCYQFIDLITKKKATYLMHQAEGTGFPNAIWKRNDS